MNSSHLLRLGARAATGAALAAGAAALSVLAGCTSAAMESNHWHVDSVGPRISYHFFGYQPSEDGRYWDRLRYDGSSAWLTIRRHFLNDDPTNPLLPEAPHHAKRPDPPDVQFTTHP